MTVSAQSVRIAQDAPIKFEFSQGNFTYLIEAELKGATATFKFSVKKAFGLPVGAAGAEFTVEGLLKRFRSKDTIVIQNNTPQNFSHSYEKLQGNATLGLAIAGSGNDAVNLELPVVIMKIPFLVGPVPVELDVKVQFVVNCVVPLDGSALIKVKFDYDSDLGFSYQGTTVQKNARLGSITFGEQSQPHTGASSAISVNFGVGFPRVELSAFNESLVGWMQTAFLIGGSFTPFFPACQTADVLFLGAAGIKAGLKLIGFSVDLGSVTFFQEKKRILEAGDCPPP
jgi:hypothetical protein